MAPSTAAKPKKPKDPAPPEVIPKRKGPPRSKAAKPESGGPARKAARKVAARKAIETPTASANDRAEAAKEARDPKRDEKAALRDLADLFGKAGDRETEGRFWGLIDAISGGLSIPYSQQAPHERQLAFLYCDLLGVREVLYGGAAGGGKSSALLMSALLFAECPGYSALIVRRSFKDLKKSEAILTRAEEWLLGKPGVRYNGNEHSFTFECPGGPPATLSFGYLAKKNDHLQYQGAAYQSVSFDELTQFPCNQYTYLFSRMRRLAGSQIPIRMRAGSNPGGPGHEWVRQRFFEDRAPGRVFIPARLEDNPSLDREDYERSLSELHPVERARLLNGDWLAEYEGNYFQKGWFVVVAPWQVPPLADLQLLRYWDKAATPGKEDLEENQGDSQGKGDWTAGVLMGKDQYGGFWILDVRKRQLASGARDQYIRQVAEADAALCGGDRRAVQIVIEQEPGSGGVDSYRATAVALAGFKVRPDKVTGSKTSRAAPLASQASVGNVRLLDAPWKKSFLNELAAFPYGQHDDQVDAASGAFNRLTERRKVRVL